MARSPAPPGPPPPHYRSPGALAPPRPVGERGFGPPPAPPPATDAIGPGAVIAVAIVTLLLGVVAGFFLGRATEADWNVQSAPPLTSPATSTSRPPGNTIPQTPPADPSAPPSTDLDPTTIGTLTDPIPVGQSYVIGLYEIEVRGVERNANDTVAAANSANPAPPIGSQHLIVQIAIRFTDSQSLGNPASIPFFVSDGAGRWNDVDARCGIIPDSLLDSGLLEKGDEAVGAACFTVPTDAVDHLVLGTDGFNGPIYFDLPE